MTFVPPPLDPDRQRRRNSSFLRNPVIGVALLAGVIALLRRRKA
jgi:hypothetical protein